MVWLRKGMKWRAIDAMLNWMYWPPGNDLAAIPPEAEVNAIKMSKLILTCIGLICDL